MSPSKSSGTLCEDKHGSLSFVILAKHGDIINCLPIIHHEFVKTGQKPIVVVSRQYSSLLERATYATPFIWTGDWQDLKGGLKLAKRKFDKVVCLSTHGLDFPIEHRTSSFCLEPYERAGLLELWDQMPLIIEHRLRSPFTEPTILFADHSQSSPFLAKQELYALLVENFPAHQIIRLSDIVLAHIADFVGLYDKADALVTIETAHLHLSAATKTPTFVLATDRPSRWHGSAPSKRFSFFCRYGEFESRKMELIEAMKDTLAGIEKLEVMALN